MDYQFRSVDSITAFPADHWNRLCPTSYPFSRYEFLHALEASGCVGKTTGWNPQHLIIESGGQTVGIIPGYEKSHSYGEYVFDWGWADAYHRHGLEYYPKRLFAIPFTPVTGSRLLTGTEKPSTSLIRSLITHLSGDARNHPYSGWHLLFVEEYLAELFEQQNQLIRNDVQFEWRNRGYGSFDEFLETLRSAKRKQIRRERRRVRDQDLQLVRKTGDEITEADWDLFFHCYQQTYAKRSGHGGYLNRHLFQLLAEKLADKSMLCLAQYQGTTVAASLFLFDSEALYGRYWGCLVELDSLHFEACYYQGIEFAIERGLKRFNPGTQGEHKLARGFEPIKTHSVHQLVNPQFHQAVAEFVGQEKLAKQQYSKSCRQHLPYRSD